MVFDKLNHSKLFKVTKTFFNNEYHEKVSENTRDTWNGICYGVLQQILFCFPLSRRGSEPIWCTFILDTNSPFNYLSAETIEKLNIHFSKSSSSFLVSINNIETNVYSSRFEQRFEGVNILGVEFLSCFDHDLIIKYRSRECDAKIVPVSKWLRDDIKKNVKDDL